MKRRRAGIGPAAAVLAGFAAAGTLLITFTQQLTREPIAENQRRLLRQRLAEVLPPGGCDDLTLHAVEVRDARLAPARAVTVYRARRCGEPAGTVYEAVAPDGYSGDILLLVGVTPAGKISGVRVLAHRETPGLGDRIERRKSRWILAFDGRSLGAPPEAQWAVRADGGAFDALTGATISARAVVEAVARVLQYDTEHAGWRAAPSDN